VDIQNAILNLANFQSGNKAHNSNKSTNQMQQFLQFIILTFIYSSTCFGRPHTHHQELNNCSSSLWFYRWSVVVTVLLVVVGPAGQPDHDQQH
jgi:hypothetical protein